MSAIAFLFLIASAVSQQTTLTSPAVQSATAGRLAIPPRHRASADGRILLVSDVRERQKRQVVWRGADDRPLPFTTAADVASFLRTAKIVKVHRKRLGGVTKPRKVVVENGGVRAQAVFRSFEREESNARWEGGKYTGSPRDTWRSDIAAYELSHVIGLDRIPPTVPFRFKSENGSLQLWLEHARPGWHPQDRDKPADPDLWQRHMESVRVFDTLIGNFDRHPYNLLVDPSGDVWWIDHSQGFPVEPDLHELESIERCERRLWDGVRNAEPAAIASAVAPYMGQKEIDALLARRLKLIDLIQKRIDERGEAAVLFDIGDDERAFPAKPNV